MFEEKMKIIYVFFLLVLLFHLKIPAHLLPLSSLPYRHLTFACVV